MFVRQKTVFDILVRHIQLEAERTAHTHTTFPAKDVAVIHVGGYFLIRVVRHDTVAIFCELDPGNYDRERAMQWVARGSALATKGVLRTAADLLGIVAAPGTHDFHLGCQ